MSRRAIEIITPFVGKCTESCASRGATTLWIHFGPETIDKENRAVTKIARDVARLVTSQLQKGAPVLLEAEARHWPMHEHLNKSVIDVKHIFTCTLGANRCKHYAFWSTESIEDVPCTCEARGLDIIKNGAENHNIYTIVVNYLLGPTLHNKFRDGKQVAQHCSPAHGILSSGSPDAVATQQCFPTEQALRQKEARKNYKAALEKQGKSKEEIKLLTKRRPQPQEDHHDDCGSDVEPLEEHSTRALLSRSCTDLDDACAYSFFDDPSCGNVVDEAYQDFLRSCSAHDMFLSSEVDDDHPSYLRKPPGSTFVAWEEIGTFFGYNPSDVIVMEMFGGKGGVTKVSMKMKLRTGKNFEVITGCDLTKEEEQQRLLKYVT